MEGLSADLASRGFLVIVDREGIVVEASGNLVFGAEGQVGRSVFDVCAKTPVLLDAFRSALGGQPVATKLAVEGTLVEAHLVPRVGSNGHTNGAVLVGYLGGREALTRDDQLARSASLLNAALESTGDGILVVDTRGKIATFNQRFLSMWRLSPDAIRRGDDETAASTASDQLEDPEGFLRGIRERYADPESSGNDVLRFEDGRVFERYTHPQRLAGTIVGRVWSFRDVTAREQLLRRTSFLSDASYLLASLDVEAALAALVDLAVKTVADACAINLFNDGIGPRRLRSAARKGANTLSTELSRAVLAGNPTVSSTPVGSHMAIPLMARTTLVGVMSFALERRGLAYSDDDRACAQEVGRRAVLAIDNAQLFRAAVEASHARDEFLAVAAHEIRGPLTVLRLAAQQLGRARGMPDSATRPLAVIVQQDRRLARFVDELLDVAALRAGKTTLKLTNVDLGEVIRDEANHLGPELAASGSSLNVSIEGRVTGFWDRSKIAIIVSKLLANAIKFGLSRPIDIRASAAAGTDTLVVMDRGVGIAEARLRAIFSPFERAASSRHYGGLGLGLYVVHELVTAMGGTVTVTSRPNAGSTFTVALPQSRAS